MRRHAVKTDDEKADATLEMMGVHCAQIAEHCDTVLILSTQKNSNGETTRLKSGEGDDYSAYGIAKAFVMQFEQNVKKGIR